MQRIYFPENCSHNYWTRSFLRGYWYKYKTFHKKGEWPLHLKDQLQTHKIQHYLRKRPVKLNYVVKNWNCQQTWIAWNDGQIMFFQKKVCLFSSRKHGLRKGLRVAIWSWYCMLIAGAMKKTTIGDTDYGQLTTLVNSAPTAPPIGLPPKGAKFCHTLNILWVGRRHCHALSWLYFNFSAVSRSLVIGWSLVVGQSTIRVPGLYRRFPSKRIRVARLYEVSLQKDK